MINLSTKAAIGAWFSFFLLNLALMAQPPGGTNAPESTYELGNVKDRSEKAHKQSDKTNEKNLKAQNKANKEAEKNRKDKLSKKKKKDDAHEFKF